MVARGTAYLAHLAYLAAPLISRLIQLGRHFRPIICLTLGVARSLLLADRKASSDSATLN